MRMLLIKTKQFIAKEKFFLIALLLISTAFIFAIPFSGEFGLNDDPNYARAVKEFAFEGKYYPENYASIMLVQIFYGAAFVKLFGFSHAILRISVMLLSLAGIMLFFAIARLFGFSQKQSFLSSLLLLTTPFFVVLGHSFMADIPFMVLALAATLPLVVWAKNNNKTALALGCALLVTAFFLKQWAILFFAGLAALVFLTKTDKKDKAIIAITALAFALALLWSLPHYALDDSGTYFKPVSGKYVLPLSFGLPFYAAWFLFPLAIIMLLNKNNKQLLFANKKKLLFSVCFSVIGIIAGFLAFKRAMPYFSNVISQFGLGPKMLAGEATGIIPEFFWLAMTLFAAVSLVFIISSIRLEIFKKRENLLIGSMSGIFFLQLAANWYFIDRYFLAILPFVFLIVLQPLKDRKLFTAGAVATIVFFGIFSFVFTSEYLAWNNTAWKLINELRSQGIPTDKIDGGMDYCLDNFGLEETRLLRTDTKYYAGICNKGCKESGYAIAFKQIAGCEIVKSEPYFVLGKEFGRIFVLKK